MLDIMIDDMKKAPGLYRPTEFWDQALEEILKDLNDYGVEQFRSHISAIRYYVPTYAFPKFLLQPTFINSLSNLLSESWDNRSRLILNYFLSGEMQAQSDYRVYLAANADAPPYINNANESRIGNPVEQFTFDGKRYSRSFLNYLLGLTFLKRTCDCSFVKTVLEIGGGYGTLGEILLSDSRNKCFYINVDIPPTSFISTYYLKELFGNSNIGDYAHLKNQSTVDIEKLMNNYKAIVLCPWQLPYVKGTIDLFVNYISFQEMEPHIVENYLKLICNLSPKYILMRNLQEGKKKKNDSSTFGVVINPVKGEDYDKFLTGYTLVEKNTEPFGYKTVDNFHSEIRLYARVV